MCCFILIIIFLIESVRTDVLWLLADFWLSYTGLDSSHTTSGRQWHLHRLSDDADVWIHTHARVQAASCLHPQGAQETQDGPVRWKTILRPSLTNFYNNMSVFVWFLCLNLNVFVQQLPERRRRATERQSFLHAPSSKRPACWKFAVREKTRKRTSLLSSRRRLPSPYPRWLNLPWRLARTTQSGSLVKTGLCFRYVLHWLSFFPTCCK